MFPCPKKNHPNVILNKFCYPKRSGSINPFRVLPDEVETRPKLRFRVFPGPTSTSKVCWRWLGSRVAPIADTRV
jgi:hypothetical protein